MLRFHHVLLSPPQAMFCSGHRESEMVDVVYKRCEYVGGCEKVRHICFDRDFCRFAEGRAGFEGCSAVYLLAGTARYHGDVVTMVTCALR